MEKRLYPPPRPELLEELGFRPPRPPDTRERGTWYYTTRIDGATSFNLRVDTIGYYSISIRNEHYGQPEQYTRMVEPYRSYTVAAIDKQVHEFRRAGLRIEYDHPKEEDDE